MARKKIPTLKTTRINHGHAPSWLSSPSWPSKQGIWGYLTEATPRMSKFRNSYRTLYSVLHCSCSGLSSCSLVKRPAISTNPKSSCLHGFHGLHVATFLAEKSAMEQCNRNRGRLTWALTPLNIPKDHQKQKSPRMHSELDRRNGAPARRQKRNDLPAVSQASLRA